LTVVAELAADFPFGKCFAAVAAGALCRIPKAMTVPTRDPAVEMVERAHSPHTVRYTELAPDRFKDFWRR